MTEKDLLTPQWALLISFFRWYPDLLLDLCEGPDCEFHLSLLNRVLLRMQARYGTTFTYACRGFGKTTMTVAGACVAGLLWPGEVIAYHAPSLVQAAPLASKAFATFQRNYPWLAAHWRLRSNSRDHFLMETECGSSFRMNIERGMDTSCVIAEECAQEDRTPFNWEDFRQVVLGTNRRPHYVRGAPDPTHVDFREQYISSATGRQNHAYAVYSRVRQQMAAGESAFALSIPWQAVVLSGMKPLQYYANLRRSLTAEQFRRECLSLCSGTGDEPLISPHALQNVRRVLIAQDRADPKAPAGTRYILGYDVSYREGSGNALSAAAVLRCTPDPAEPGLLRKELVYVADFPPPASAREHALQIRRFWARWRHPGSPEPIICVDANGYGHSVAEALLTLPPDGLPPLGLMRPDPSLTPLQSPAALRLLYPMRASGPAGGQDPNPDMIDYVAREVENGRLLLLAEDGEEGLRRTRLQQGITDPASDAALLLPYAKTTELLDQIANLVRRTGPTGWTEKALSSAKRKDMWSALLYAARIADYLEQEGRRQARPDPYDTWDDGFFPEPAPRRRSMVTRLGRNAV